MNTAHLVLGSAKHKAVSSKIKQVVAAICPIADRGGVVDLLHQEHTMRSNAFQLGIFEQFDDEGVPEIRLVYYLAA